MRGAAGKHREQWGRGGDREATRGRDRGEAGGGGGV